MLPCHCYTFSPLLNSLKPLRPLYHNFILSSHLDLFTIFMQVQLSHPKPLLPLVTTFHYIMQHRPFFTPATYSFAKATSFLYLSCILVFFFQFFPSPPTSNMPSPYFSHINLAHSGHCNIFFTSSSHSDAVANSTHKSLHTLKLLQPLIFPCYSNLF